MKTTERIKEVTNEIAETSKRCLNLDQKLTKAFEEGTTGEIDFDFVKTMISATRNTIKSETNDILAYRASKNRLR